jgi:hypothetical protein
VKKKIKVLSTNVNDYPKLMSLYEKESLAAEAILAAERKARKKPAKRKRPISQASNSKRRGP